MSKPPLSVLISGASGYLGTPLAQALHAEGAALRLLARDPNRIKLNQLGISGNCTVLDEAQLNAQPHVPSVVVHCATCYGRKGESESEVRECNVGFSARLLDWAINSGVKTFINIDTCLPPEASLYALTKREFRIYAQRNVMRSKIEFVNVVTQHFFGAFDDPSKLTGMLFEKCLRNDPQIDLTPGQQERDFLYIDDAVAGLVTLAYAALDSARPLLPQYELGSGRAVPVRRFAELIKHHTGASTWMNFGAIPYRPNEPMHLVANITALQQLGWAPRYSLDQGIARVVELMRAT